MAEGVAVIDQGVLRDPQNRTFGLPDLLVRSDVLAELFPDALSSDEAAVAAPDLGIGDRHYIVVDIKYTTLGLTASGWRARQFGFRCRVQGAAARLQPGAGQAAGLPCRHGRSCWAAGGSEPRGVRVPGATTVWTALPLSSTTR